MKIDWKRTEPPRDRKILVYGKPEDTNGDNAVRFLREGVHLAFWDALDEAFCLDGGGWLGPFIEPIAWAEAPEGPEL